MKRGLVNRIYAVRFSAFQNCVFSGYSWLVEHRKCLFCFFYSELGIHVCGMRLPSLITKKIAVLVSIWWLTEFESLFLFDNPVKHVLLSFYKVLVEC